jgi:CIC family chloride channel protein
MRNGRDMKSKRVYKNPNLAEVIFLVTAVLIGITVGATAILFKKTIQFIETFNFEKLPSLLNIPTHYFYLIIPILGGLIVGPIVHFLAQEAKGTGIPEVMQAVTYNEGKIRPRVSIIKFIATAISLGTGFSAGREGPIVQIGASIGSTIGQWLHLSEHKIKNFVACGAAAGIAATFNAPIAGVIFSLEVVLGEFHLRHFSSVVIAAVAASIVNQASFGQAAAFTIPTEYGITNSWEYALYPFLGILSAFWAVLFIKTLYATTDKFESIKKIPAWLKPAFAGLLLGVIAFIYMSFMKKPLDTQLPSFYSIGYQSILSALTNELPLKIALLFLGLKLIATSLSIGSGASGGVFAPSLYMGAMLGTAFDIIIHLIFPNIVSPPGAYAIVGMAATFAATSQAPISTILMLFELTHDYKLILPLMLTVVIATYITQKMLDGESIFTLKLKNRGIRLKRGHDLDILENVLVYEVMTTDILSLSPEQSLSDAEHLLNQSHRHCAIVEENDVFKGIITISNIDKAIAEKMDLHKTTVSDITNALQDIQIAHPNETIGHALAKMSIKGVGHLPVVSPTNSQEIVGFINREEIVRAYKLALTRKMKNTSYPTDSF